MGEVNPTMLDPEEDSFDFEETGEGENDFDQETETTESHSDEEPLTEDNQEVTIQDGAILEGEIIRTDESEAFVDFGWQSEGLLPYDQVHDGSVSEGQTLTVKILQLEREEDLPLLSETEALADRAWHKVRRARKQGRPVEGTIFKEIKGGYLVRLFDVLTAFMPKSHLSSDRDEDSNQFMNNTYQMKVLETDRDNNNVVVSRREYLEEKQKQKEASFFTEHEEGEWVEGTVKNVVNFGAFVNLGPVDGLLHVSEISWGPIRNVEDHLNEGDDIEVKILSMNPEESEVSLGLKQEDHDPWETIHERYEQGQATTGEITDIREETVFVRLEPHVTGTIQEDELSWTKTWQHPEDQFQEGETVEVKILNIDEERRVFDLSRKQTSNNPWQILQDRFPEGTVLKAPVVDIHEDHLNVKLLQNVEGIIHRRDISWEDEEVDLYESFSLNEKIKCKIIDLSPEGQHVKLGIKQTTPDPWVRKIRDYEVGNTLEGTVTNVQPFGAFVEIEEGIEGLVHVSNMTEDKRVNPHEVVNQGDTVGVKILDINENEHKIDLSIQAYEQEQKREEMEEYIDEGSESEGEPTMGDVFGEDLNEIITD